MFSNRVALEIFKLKVGIPMDELKEKKILVVDDQPQLLRMVDEILRRVYVPIRQEQLPAFSLGDRTVDLGASLVRAQDGREWTLTAKEHALLKKLYENRNRIVTSDALCQAAWGDDLYGYENTLMVHIRRMREKLEQDPSHPQYLLTARGLGYKLQLAPTKNA